MAVTTTARLQITDWSAGTDPFTRAQLSADHERLEQVVAIFGQGTLATRPAPGVQGRFYWATDGAASTTLTYDNGTAWGSHPHAIGDLPVAASGASSTTLLVRADDSRLSDARTPLAHSHAIGDLPVAASGTSSTTLLVRADDARLSDARTPTAHTHAAGDITSGVFGIGVLPVAASGTSSTTQLVRADDSRLSNARTPTAHASTHASGGSDALALDAAQITTGTLAAARGGTGRTTAWTAGAVVFASSGTVLSQTAAGTSGQLLQSAGASAPVWATPGTAWLKNAPSTGNAASTEVVLGSDTRLTDARTPTAHSHAIGDLPVAASGTSSTTQLVRADDARLSNARTPTAHASTHAAGGSDPLTLTTAQVTNLDSQLAAKAPTASPTFTGTTTVGGADTDVEKLRAVTVEVDGRAVTLAYNGDGTLATVTEKSGATTVKTTTLTYSGGNVSTVAEAAGGQTATTTFTYDGSGTLTGTTRSVA